MTANQTHPAGADFLAGLLAAGGHAARIAGKIFLAVMIVMAAGIVAVATAVAGLFLAAAAIVLRFTATRRPQSRPATEPGEPVTLEARRTARGWTVE